ncbi:M15 family metallopeptidase [Pseudomonadota bacterium]
MPHFGKSSTRRLASCHNDLQRLFNEVIKERDCSILCGFRCEVEQDEAYQSGKSKVMWPNSNHNSNPSMAVDVAPYPIDWDDLERFDEFADFVKAKADEMGIAVRWGGDFSSFYDGPHWEIV